MSKPKKNLEKARQIKALGNSGLKESFLVLIVEHAMAVALKIWVFNLRTKLRADALILLCALQTAGAITAGAFQALFDRCNHFFIFVQSDSHTHTLLFLYHTTFVNRGKSSSLFPSSLL